MTTVCNKLVVDELDGVLRSFRCQLEAGHDGEHSPESRWDRIHRGEEPGGLNRPDDELTTGQEPGNL